MSAIAYSAINWSDYLQDNPKYNPKWIGASGTSLDDVVHAKGQYGGIGGARWNLVDNQKSLSKGDAAILQRAANVATGISSRKIGDPNGGKTFGMRTLNSDSPGKNYTAFPQITGSRNTFYTVDLP